MAESVLVKSMVIYFMQEKYIFKKKLKKFAALVCSVVPKTYIITLLEI